MARSHAVSCRLFLLVWLAGGVFSSAGCRSGPKVYPVKGKVVNKGKGHVKDLAGYTVQFQSVSDPEERPGGPIAEDGTFVLYTRVGGSVIPGVKEGTYRACLLPPVLEGRPSPRPVIPLRYTSPETSKLEYTIPGGSNDITIEVDRNAP